MRGPDSSFGEGAVVFCLGVVHVEEEVPDREQGEVGGEEQEKARNRERPDGQSTAQHG